MSRLPQPLQAPPPPDPYARPGPSGAAVHAVTLGLALFLGIFGVPAAADPLPTHDTGGRVVGPAFGDVDDINAGDCFNTEDDLKDYQEEDAQAPLSVDIVPCDEPHQSEAVVIFDLPDGAYPGKQKINSVVGEKCDKGLTDYVGAGAKLPETMQLYSYHPSPATWTAGERGVACFVGDSSGSSTGSVRASGS
ncbi:septum formation family protein [Streptomyces sp. NPDC051211]|uniref:septum formation family protein n=1 Tax=Streptomyces sp. NPDC051211 TaxID=3154643 RepID=UPI00344BE2B8